MAETKKAAESKAELEEVFIPKGNQNDEPNLFVSINGVNYLLPKGKKSKVPPWVAYEIRRSQAVSYTHLDVYKRQVYLLL